MSPVNTIFNPWLTLMRALGESSTARPLECSAAVEAWPQFLSVRFKEDLEFWRRLGLCRTPMDIQKVYIDFWRTAFEQYQEYYAQAMAVTQPPPRAKEQPIVHHRQRAAA